MLNKLHINSVYCTQGGMYITGLKDRRDAALQRQALAAVGRVARGSHNAQPFRDGVLFNDTEADALRYAGRGEGREDRALPVPRYRDDELLNRDLDQSRLARQGFARGLCTVSDHVVAGGSSPSTVTLYDLAANKRLLSVNLSMDVRNAIHGLKVWPYD